MIYLSTLGGYWNKYSKYITFLSIVVVFLLQCSVTCGPGVETRDVICPLLDDHAQDFACTDEKPVTSRLCEMPECPCK